jgi:hypothetical protein
MALTLTLPAGRLAGPLHAARQRAGAARQGRALRPHRLLGRARGGRSARRHRPWLQAAVDWDATIAYRQRLWSLGLGVAEAMDTAQRGMGLDWPTSLELIRRSLDAARDVPGRAGRVRLRHRPPRARGRALGRRRDPRLRRADGRHREAGRQAHRHGQPRAGPRRQGPADYERVYDHILRRPSSRSSCTGWARCSIRRWPATGAAPTPTRPWTPPSASSPPTRPRSTASRSRCSTRTRKSPCAAACRPACACTRATTSTTPS